MRPTVLSYGLGADSTAILLKFLDDPTSYGLREDLSDLTVLHAVTGDEWPDSLEYVDIGKSGYHNLRNARGERASGNRSLLEAGRLFSAPQQPTGH